MATNKPKDAPKKQREFGVILESIDSNVKRVLEAFDDHTKQIKDFDSYLDEDEEY